MFFLFSLSYSKCEDCLLLPGRFAKEDKGKD